MDLILPKLDTSGIQAGLRDLGGALQYQADLQDARDATSATLAVRRAFTDKIGQLRKSGDFSQDWGELAREAGGQILDQQQKTFKNPRAFEQFKNQQLLTLEQAVPGLRDEQATASTQHDQQFLATNTESAKQQASQDLVGAARTLNIAWGATPALDPATGAKSVGFSPVALNAFKGNGLTALQNYQKGVDDLAGTYLGTKIDAIVNANDTAARKVEMLAQLQKRAWSEIQGADLHVSAASRAKLDDAITGAIGTAQKAAYEEFKAQSAAELTGITTQLYDDWSQAKQGGAAFDPTDRKNPWVAQLHAVAEDPSRPQETRDDAVKLIKELTLQADKGISPDDRGKMIKASEEQAMMKLQLLLQRGASTQNLVNEVNRMKADGEIAIESYNNLTDWSKKGAGLEAFPEVKASTALFDSIKDEQTRARLVARFKAEIGGLYKDTPADAYRDPKTGSFKPDVLKNRADAMLKALNDSNISNLLRNKVVADEKNTIDFVTRATSGQFIGQVGAEDVAEKSRPYAVFLFESLKKTSRNGVTGIKPTPLYDLYNETGLPYWEKTDGTIIRPIVKDGKISWTTSGAK